MATRTTTWKPDTCPCVIELEWDDEVDVADRKHIIRSIVKCEFHTKADQDVGKTLEIDPISVHIDNKIKNQALGISLTEVPSLSETDPDGNLNLKKEYEYKFNFQGLDENRTLQIEFKNAPLDPADKAAIQTSIDSDIGPGKITVQ